MITLSEIKDKLRHAPKTWLVTGCGGFIGSHILEQLLDANQKVIGIDNFSTGSKENLVDVQKNLSGACWGQFEFFNEDLRNLSPDSSLLKDVDYVLHQAAMASVPFSIENPLETFDINVFGTEILLELARRSRVKKVVVASSSAVYGDDPADEKREEQIGQPLSPYATSKYINERQVLQLAQVFNIPTVALRYFNAYGPRQSTDGAYAAVIPAWKNNILANQAPKVFGDGSQTRDFLHVHDVVKANLLAALQNETEAKCQVFNVGGGISVSLLELFQIMKETGTAQMDLEPQFLPDRPGDIKHSRSSIQKIRDLLNFEPEVTLQQGLKQLLGTPD